MTELNMQPIEEIATFLNTLKKFKKGKLDEDIFFIRNNEVIDSIGKMKYK